MQNSSSKLVPNTILCGPQQGEYLNNVQNMFAPNRSLKPFGELTNLPLELSLRKQPIIIPRLKQPTQLFWSVCDSEGEQSPPQFNNKGVFSAINPQSENKLEGNSRLPQFLFEYHESSDEEQQISEQKNQCEQKSEHQDACESNFATQSNGLRQSHFSNDIRVNRQSMMTNQGQITKCLLRRDRRNRQGNIEFNLYDANTLLHLLTVTKSQLGLIFSLKNRNSLMKPIYHEIAVMKTNIFGNKFTLLERDGDGTGKGSLVTICYDSNFLGLNGSRTFTVYIPRHEAIAKQYLNECYKGNNIQKIERFMSKPLNNSSQGIQKSVKNFLLEIDQLEKPVGEPNLLFRKLQEDVFSLDVGGPFSIVQAAGIAVSTFDINSS